MNNIQKLKEIINKSNNIVFFGGAGVSTASGIKDFRSKDGLYHEKYDYEPEKILSHSFFINHTDYFYKFYKEKLNVLNKEPNVCHNYLVELEKENKLKAIITQNIDGLHEKAGSKNIYNLHGTIYKNHCLKCGKSYDASYVFNSKDIPICCCKGIIKPDVVLYEEPLNEIVINNAINVIENCNTLIIAGTSLLVYPASSFINYFQGNNLVIINNDPTPYDKKANLIINENIKDVFNKLKK